MLDALRRALTQDGAERRVRIATAMALVAMLGAVTTFRASQNELIASGCARRHAVAQTYFIYRKQWFADRLGENGAYVDAYKTHISRARRYLQTASTQLARGSPDKAFFQIEAQLEYATARQLQPLKAFTDVELDDKLALGPALDKKADLDLRSIGFRGGCAIGVAHPAQSSALQMLASDTDAVRARAIRCAVAVVFFVLGLVFFTLSEAVGERFKHACEAAGYVLSVFAIAVGIFWADGALAAQYALAVAAFAIIAAIGWAGLRVLQRRAAAASGTAAEPEETEPLRYEEFDTDSFRAKHLHLIIPHDKFSRTVVVLIAIAAFLSAIAGLSYSAAIATSEHNAMIAATHQAGIVNEYGHVSLDLDFIMREMQVGMEADLRESALQVVHFGAAPQFGSSDVAPWLYEGVQWTHAYDDFGPANLPTMHQYLEGDDGPYLDARYPYEMYYRREAIPPARELALADAYDEDAAIFERGATYCLFMLTVFAIALYLFGQALAMGTSNGARILAFFGSVLIFAGVGAGIRTAILTRTSNGDVMAFSAACPRPTSSPAPPPTRAEVAASCYAQGEYAHAVANDREEYKPSIDAYRRTVTLRPHFALAQYDLLKMEAEYDTPQRTDYWSIEDPNLLPQMLQDRKAVADALNDRELGPPQWFVGTGAFESYILSLATRDRALLRSSLAMARSDPDLSDDPTSHYNVGLMLLADKDFAHAHAAYVAGMQIQPADKEGDVSGVSDLELLRTHCSALPWHTPQSCGELARVADGIKTELVQHAFSTPAPDPPPSHVQVRAWVAPDGVAWSAPEQQLRHIHGDLAVLWYLKDPGWQSWYVHLALMHSTNAVSMQQRGDSLVDYESYLDDSGFIRCLPTQQDFRVEIYNGGRLIGASDPLPGRAGDPVFEGGQFGTADIGFCRPKAPAGKPPWTRRINTRGYLDGSYNDPSGEFGIRAFAYYAPKQPTQSSSDALALRLLNNFLFTANKFGLRPAAFNCPAPVNPFHAVHVRALAPGNNILGESWATPDGLLHFVIVRHTWTQSAIPDRIACEILASAQPVYGDMY